MQIEIINNDFVIYNKQNLSVTIHYEALEDLFYSQYVQDRKVGSYSDDFKSWVLDYDKCFEYLNRFLTL